MVGHLLTDRCIIAGTDRNVSVDLAEVWPAFVDCDVRLKTVGPFLLRNLLSKHSIVFDAAMGVGCETVFLMKQGFNVIGNEICPHLLRIASVRAREAGVSLQYSTANWLELSGNFKRGEFDAVLLLGNSFCLLQGPEERFETARNLRHVCRDGGKLIIDERNFEYILSSRDQILSGKFRYCGKVMYCGTDVRGYPVLIDNKRIRFAYEVLSEGRIAGYLDMQLLRFGEMTSIFRRAGFSRVSLFSDLQPGYSPDADFYTYVFD